MKTRGLFLVVFSLVLFSAFVSATQIIVLNDSVEKAYSLEEVTVSGDLATNTLRLEGTGEVISGENVKVYLFGPSTDILIRDVLVNGKKTSVSFDGEGYFFLSEKGAFTFYGALDVRTIGQIRLYSKGPMNKITFKLRNGYAVGGDVYGAYKKEIVIQRSEKAAMLIEGSFKFTYAERNTFRYIINYKAFGTSLGRYELDLPNGETISDVSGAYKWEQNGNKLILDLESDKATVSVSGLFNSQNLRVPLKEGRHNVLIESDPEKKITISTSAQEIDLTESTVSPSYSNARAFLASNRDNFNVLVKQLELTPSLAASVSYANNRVAVTEKGSIVGELTYQYANTGVDYITLDVDATPLYASTGSSSVKLTKDNKLLLSFPKTQHGNLDFVYFTTRNPIAPVDFIDVPLAESDLPISTATTEIYLPRNQFVLWVFGAQGGSELPSIEFALLFTAFVAGIGYALKKKIKFMIYYFIFAVGLFMLSPLVFVLFMLASLIELARKHVKLAGGTIISAVIILMILGGLFLGLILFWQLGVFNTGQASYSTKSLDISDEAAVPTFNGMERIGSGEGAITVPTKTGVLPVKLELPYMGKQIRVTNYLVTKENQQKIRILVIADYFKYVFYLLGIFALIKGGRMYKRG
jgi:hypothetical protein